MSGPHRCEIVALERVYDLAFELSAAIRAAGYAPDLVIAIARGGFVPARLVCDFLLCSELTSITVRHYAAGARREAGARMRHPLAADVRGRRVLIVDDINETGETLEAARAHVAERGAAQVRTGVLHERPYSRLRADFRATAAPAEADWLIYQWALVEDAVAFLASMEPPPKDDAAAREGLAREFGVRLDDAQWRRVAAARDR